LWEIRPHQPRIDLRCVITVVIGNRCRLNASSSTRRHVKPRLRSTGTSLAAAATPDGSPARGRDLRRDRAWPGMGRCSPPPRCIDARRERMALQMVAVAVAHIGSKRTAKNSLSGSNGLIHSDDSRMPPRPPPAWRSCGGCRGSCVQGAIAAGAVAVGGA
jgi:hypothetical protein